VHKESPWSSPPMCKYVLLVFDAAAVADVAAVIGGVAALCNS
jgi:hypothetical protein